MSVCASNGFKARRGGKQTPNAGQRSKNPNKYDLAANKNIKICYYLSCQKLQIRAVFSTGNWIKTTNGANVAD